MYSLAGCNMKQIITLFLPYLLCLPTIYTHAQGEFEPTIQPRAEVELKVEAKPTVPARDRSVQLNLEDMAIVKTNIANNQLSPAAQETYTELLRTADKAIEMPLESVTFKRFTPPGGNKHDYMSISRYWWPTSREGDGTPWVRKDGQTNPTTQSDDVDRQRLGRFLKTVNTLSLAYYFSNNEAYAQKAINFVNTWFLDEKTKMNPHLAYAQMVPGNPKSRSSGILDGRGIGTHLLDSLVLISTSTHWSNTQQNNMDQWLTSYLTWLTKDKLGRSALKKSNNHGSWYRYHVAAVAWYLNDIPTVKKMIEATKKSIFIQIDGQGKQKHELNRTRSYFYSYFNLDAQTRIAIIANKLGIDLWRYKSPSGTQLITAIDYMTTYSDGTVKWPYKTKGAEIALMQSIFLRAEVALNNGRYKRLLNLDPYAETPFGKIKKNLDALKQERYLLTAYEL